MRRQFPNFCSMNAEGPKTTMVSQEPKHSAQAVGMGRRAWTVLVRAGLGVVGVGGEAGPQGVDPVGRQAWRGGQEFGRQFWGNSNCVQHCVFSRTKLCSAPRFRVFS